MRSLSWWCAVALLAACTDTTNLTTQPDMRPAFDLSSVFPMGCTSGALDGQETDVDCGGPECPPCLAGQACKMGRDCQSTFCTNNACEPPSCTDKVKNGTETDVDCGGGACDGCAEGQSCNGANDCKSATCTNGKCAPGPCTNGVKDGLETDIDCGGGTCPPCDGGKSCAAGTDCKSGTCRNNVCESALMCIAGTADCDGNAANGCEVNTNTDAKNCGRCGNVCPMNTPTCGAGKCGVSTRVLLVHSADALRWQDVQAKISGTGAFAVVDAFDAKVDTPTVQQLQKYDVALVWSDAAYADVARLGTNLATYYDQGGRVVLAAFAINLQFQQVGFFDSKQGYVLLGAGYDSPAPDSLDAIAEPLSPLLAGVKTFKATAAFSGNGTLLNGAVVVARWASGKPLVLRGVVKGRRRADLNLYPVSADALANMWMGDGANLMRNALLYQ